MQDTDQELEALEAKASALDDELVLVEVSSPTRLPSSRMDASSAGSGDKRKRKDAAAPLKKGKKVGKIKVGRGR